MFRYGLYLCCLAGLILICACGKRDMTVTDEKLITEIIQETNLENGNNNHTRNLLHGDKILNLVKNLNDRDKIYYAKAFAYQTKGCHYYLRRDTFTANSYYLQSMKFADRIRYNKDLRIAAKSDNYHHFYMLFFRKKQLAEFWLDRWGKFFLEYMKTPEYLNGDKQSNSILLMRYGVYVEAKIEYLANAGKVDSAVEQLNALYSEVKKFYSDPDDFLWAFPFSDTAAGIFARKNDSEKMIFYARKTLKLAEQGNIFPENSYFIIIRHHMQNGNYIAAEKYCLQGLKLWQSSQVKPMFVWKIRLMIMLAETLWRSGNKRRAQEILSQAERLKPPPDFMDKIKKCQKEWF